MFFKRSVNIEFIDRDTVRFTNYLYQRTLNIKTIFDRKEFIDLVSLRAVQDATKCKFVAERMIVKRGYGLDIYARILVDSNENIGTAVLGEFNYFFQNNQNNYSTQTTKGKFEAVIYEGR